MNLLTDKALTDYTNWLLTDYIPSTRPDYKKFTDSQILGKINRMGETLQFALIQEWLDSVGYYIHTDIEQDDEGKILFKPTVIRNGEVISPPYEVKKSRNESVKWAIECANFKYN